MTRNLVCVVDELEDEATLTYVQAFLNWTFDRHRTRSYPYMGINYVIMRRDYGIEVLGERTPLRGIRKIRNVREIEESIADEMCRFLESPEVLYDS